MPQNYFFDDVDPQIEAATRKAIEHYASLGASIVEVSLPYAEQIMGVEFGLCLPEASAYHQQMLRERAELYGEDVRVVLEAGELIPAVDYIKALRVRQMMKQAWAALYTQIDAMIAPSVVAPATRRGQDSIDWGNHREEPIKSAFVRLSAPANVTGLPSVAVT